MDKEQVARINELARRRKAGTLSPEEIIEHDALRRQYLDEFRENMRSVLENTYIERPDGTREKLQRKTGNA